MSNLLKSKFLLGAMVVAVMFVGVVAVSATPAAADCTVTPTVKVGSTGASVQCVQSKVGVTADGSFGPMTKAAVVAFQSSHSLSADGVVGPMTAAALNGVVSSGTFPAGCTSSAGFSTTTGMPCNSSTTLPAGCMSTAGYSSTTGVKCDGGSSSTSTGPLGGGAGDIDVTRTSTDVEDTVNEGGSDVKVLGFKVEAQGGDIALTNLKVSFQNTDPGDSSTRLDHYIDGVSVWMGGTKVGSADVSDFTKSGTEYTKSIALSNAVVREGSSKKQTFYIAVDALNNIDSGDFEGEWTVKPSSVRFQDSTGIVLTADLPELVADGEQFHFSSLSASGDVKVTVSKDSSNPVAQNVVVSDTSTTKNVLMLAFKVKAAGSDITFDTLTVNLDSDNADLSDILGELILKNGSSELASESSFAENTTDEVIFNLDDEFTISADSTEVFKIYATVNDSDNFAASGVRVSFADFAPEDENGDTVSENGSAAGEYQTFVQDVPTVALVGTPTLALQTHTDGTATGEEDLYKATIVMDVTAPDDSTIYLPLDTYPYGTNKDKGVVYTATAGTVVSAALQYSGSDSLLDTNSYRIDAGDTQRFTFTVYLKGDDTQGKVQITSLWYRDNTPSANDTTSSGFDGETTSHNFSVDTGWTNFKTPLVLLSK